MRLIISGGGTGGHVYPALAVVPELKRYCADLDLLWVGSQKGMEKALVQRAEIAFAEISAAGLRGKNPVAFLSGLGSLNKGYQQSLQIIRHFKPDALFVTGGYVSVPVTVAAWRLGVPVLIYLPDIEPGLAIKFLARFARMVAVTTPDTQRFFKPGQTMVTGYPVRAELSTDLATLTSQAHRQAAWQQLGLHDDWPVLFVFGGSQGARSINQTVSEEVAAYLEVCQIVHMTGILDEAWVQDKRNNLASELQDRYHVAAYLHEQMIPALIAADVVVSRAGASVLGEFPAVGLPSILVPGPFAGAHQGRNAEYLARHGAALIVDNADLKRDLKTTVLNLIQDREKLDEMRRAAHKLAQPEAASRLAQAILEVRNNG